MVKLLSVSVLVADAAPSAGKVQSTLRVGDTNVMTLVSVTTLVFGMFLAESVTKLFCMNYGWSGVRWLGARGQSGGPSGPWPRLAMIAGEGRMMRR